MDLKQIENKVAELCWAYTPQERKDQLVKELKELRVLAKMSATGASWSIVPYGEELPLAGVDAKYEALSEGVKAMLISQRKQGHGHVWERPDGVKARCGGPALCHICSHDQAWLDTLSDLEKQFFLS